MPADRRISITLGAMAPTLTHQFRAMGLRVAASQIRVWQRQEDAISLLAIHALLSTAEAERARHRLVRDMRNWLTLHKEAYRGR